MEADMIDYDNLIALDYIISNKHLEKQRNRDPAVEFKRNALTVKLKNAVMYYIVKNRDKKKTPSLGDVLVSLVEKKKKELQAKRKKKTNFTALD